ncbi:GspH/FimT family pseudopilin [Ralstonia soli]|uniref:Type II secretion system protein H n=1 Tax=Ralstonia soli TaxID=2953896 RepID=A0ABT1AK10_9RALS|nr:GspH/FimT family pseudopilin [Ralstonia soli]MCO5398447.1 GspH/FimT family pseudopilin [Ralstonia soli]
MLAMKRLAHRACKAGVTLMELAIVIAIVGILAMAALPSIIDRWQRETVILLADRFASTVSLARAMAQYQHIQTNIVQLDNRVGWDGGWALTTQQPVSNPDRTAKPVPVPPLLSVSAVSVPKVPAVQISFRIRDQTLSYAPVGYSRDSNGGPRYGTLTISSGRHTRQVRISNVGRVRICDPVADSKSCPLTGDDSDSDP